MAPGVSGRLSLSQTLAGLEEFACCAFLSCARRAAAATASSCCRCIAGAVLSGAISGVIKKTVNAQRAILILLLPRRERVLHVHISRGGRRVAIRVQRGIQRGNCTSRHGAEGRLQPYALG